MYSGGLARDAGMRLHPGPYGPYVHNPDNPVKVATLALQKQDINLRDFYGIWLRATHGLKSNGTILANCIVNSMKKRQTLLFNNNVFLAGM